jgi:hemoglobin
MRKILFAITLSVGLLAACPVFARTSGPNSNAPAGKTTQTKSLYDRLGGKKAIIAVVNQFVDNVGHDDRINKYFAKTVADPKRLDKFKKNLVDQICEASGGPCKYKGKNMKDAHMGMGITDGDFNALVEDLVAALNKFNVGDTEKNQLLGALGPMRPDIVGH